MDLLTELRATVARKLAWFNVDVPPRATVHDACVLLARVLARRLSPTPRGLHLSSALTTGPSYAANKAGVDAVAAAIKAGDDLTARMSTKMATRPAWDDGLLNDWAIYHFHLGALGAGPSVGGIRFAGRTGPVLFAMVTATDAFLIQIMNHRPQPWACQDLLEIVHTEWPHLIEHALLPGVTALAHKVTEDEHIRLRAAGIVSPIQLRSGAIYMVPGGGYSTTGLSTKALALADTWRSRTKEIQEWLDANGHEAMWVELKILGREVVATERATGRPMLMPDQECL